MLLSPLMFCCAARSHSQYVDDALATARNSLENEKRGLDTVPIVNLPTAAESLLKVVSLLESPKAASKDRWLDDLVGGVGRLANLFVATSSKFRARLMKAVSTPEDRKEILDALSRSPLVRKRTTDLTANLEELRKQAHAFQVHTILFPPSLRQSTVPVDDLIGKVQSVLKDFDCLCASPITRELESLIGHGKRTVDKTKGTDTRWRIKHIDFFKNPCPVLLVSGVLCVSSSTHSTSAPTTTQLSAKDAPAPSFLGPTLPLSHKVLLTSRPEDRIEETISTFSKEAVFSINLNLQPRKSVDADIKLFFHDRLAHMVPEQDLSSGRAALIDRLTERSEGFFTYAAAAADFLAQYPEDLDERAELLLSNPPRSALLRPLAALDLPFLSRALPAAEHDPAQAALVHALVLLRAPLSPRALHTLVGVPLPEVTAALVPLRAALLSDPRDADAPVRALHPYFTRLLAERVPARLSRARTHGSRPRAFAHSSAPPPLSPLASRAGQADKAAAETEDDVRYARLHWAAHVAQADRADRGVLAPVERFARTAALPGWVAALGELGALDAVDDALARASGWQELGPTCALFEHARAWVAEHRRELEECPGKIYEAGIEQAGAKREG
ncbi:uncharacterized protein BXZ73DRAFT_101087 [Epithele typhae]|uniref:uncharacterized protein n=1 Tax=Epithele typhae TaxID=378194 RepID=UPI00200769B6|nr:uncharacterized protein BXZ73DRAFT_101087 [Epithele typhae]KAH9933117.1 hypothetical protein BXZ73DRAFT_101087 [Epithele typhae]